jgi:hypothetical protein
MLGKYKVTYTEMVTDEFGANWFWNMRAFYFNSAIRARVANTLLNFWAYLCGCSHTSWVIPIAKYSVSTDLPISYADEGRWRSYHLETCGDSFDEMLDNSSIEEIDKDGGTINSYSLSEANDYSSTVQALAIEAITKAVKR